MFLLKSKFPKYFRYHGRKVSKKLSFSKITLLNNSFYDYSFDEQIINRFRNKDIENEFIIPQSKFTKINIEIGFGNGDFLIQNALSNPSELFIGIEVYLNGIARVLSNVISLGIKNIKLSNLNCLYFLNALPTYSIDRIYIINPDPWLKKRHYKRRLISLENLKLFRRVIKKRDSIYITTDSESYLKHITELLNENEELLGKSKIETLCSKDKFYNISRYQQKATKIGKKIYLRTL